MRLVVPPLIVEETDSFKNDILERKGFGEALLNIIVQSEDELVIYLDGDWGEGKTTFVKMWQGLLAENSVPNIYIDAFSNDFIDDAFLSVASAITNYANKNIKKSNNKKLAELKDKTKKVGGRLLSLTTRIIIKAATLGAIKDTDIDELKDIKDDMAKSLSDMVGSCIEDRLDSHSEDVALIQSFRDMLSSLPSMLKGENDKPLVIIIDELDRYKPTFAVEILEKIKHLFSVKNVVFVLVMNKAQLEESIRCVYGQNIDAHTYLQKFVNIESKLPKRTEDKHINDHRKYSTKLLELHEFQAWGDDDSIIDDVCVLANHFNLSLRQLEKVFTNLTILYGSFNKSSKRIVPIIVFVCVIKVVNTMLFDKLLNRNTNFDEVRKETNLINIDQEKEINAGFGHIIRFVRCALLSKREIDSLPNDNDIREYAIDLNKSGINRQRLIPGYAERLSMFRIT